jgi:hypothetical protein
VARMTRSARTLPLGRATLPTADLTDDERAEFERRYRERGPLE